MPGTIIQFRNQKSNKNVAKQTFVGVKVQKHMMELKVTNLWDGKSGIWIAIWLRSSPDNPGSKNHNTMWWLWIIQERLNLPYYARRTTTASQYRNSRKRSHSKQLYCPILWMPHHHMLDSIPPQRHSHTFGGCSGKRDFFVLDIGSFARASFGAIGKSNWFQIRRGKPHCRIWPTSEN